MFIKLQMFPHRSDMYIDPKRVSWFHVSGEGTRIGYIAHENAEHESFFTVCNPSEEVAKLINEALS